MVAISLWRNFYLIEIPISIGSYYHWILNYCLYLRSPKALCSRLGLNPLVLLEVVGTSGRKLGPWRQHWTPAPSSLPCFLTAMRWTAASHHSVLSYSSCPNNRAHCNLEAEAWKLWAAVQLCPSKWGNSGMLSQRCKADEQVWCLPSWAAAHDLLTLGLLQQDAAAAGHPSLC